MVFKRRTGPGVRALPIAASAAAHLVVLIALVWRLGAFPELPETPVINVQLTPRHRPSPDRPVTRDPERAAAARAAPVPSAPSEPVLPRDPAIPEATPWSGGQVRGALRGLLGCRHAALAGLTPDERRRCEEQLATAAARDLGPAAARLNLDLHGDYARNPEAYLNRWPKNGCKPRAGGDVGPMGQQGAAAGVSCAWDF